MSAEPTAALARFAATLDHDALPERTREAVKDLLLDALACALAGHRGEETAQVEALARALASSEEADVIGGGRASLAGATLLNAYLVTAVTMCDVHRPTLTHITPEVVPPALAIAARDQRPGRELLVALAAGCEITTRIGLGLDFAEFRRRGWHGPGVIGPFGAAAAVGRLRGFDADTMARAFGLAGSQSAGTFAAWGTPTVKFHQCRGALSGLMAALLAEQSFVATREFLSAADGGLYSTYTDGGRPQAALEALGERWELEHIALRPWPSASTIQGLITAMFDLVEHHDVKAPQVRRVRVALSATGVAMHGTFPRYQGKFEAMLSAHYAVAAILHDRALTLEQFEPARYSDPALQAFAAHHVEVSAHDALDGVQAMVQVHTADGRTLEARCDATRGSPENPLSRAQVETKFRTYAKDRLEPACIEAVIAAVAHLEDLPSSAQLMDLLACAEPAPASAAA